jgi:hypothetical protein
MLSIERHDQLATSEAWCEETALFEIRGLDAVGKATDLALALVEWCSPRLRVLAGASALVGIDPPLLARNGPPLSP